MHSEPDAKLIELRIARAYVDLLCVPDHTAPRAIPIARVDNHEIRLFLDPRIEAADVPLFWMELFDHGANASTNSYACWNLSDAAQIFEQFRLEATPSGAAPIEPQG